MILAFMGLTFQKKAGDTLTPGMFHHQRGKKNKASREQSREESHYSERRVGNRKCSQKGTEKGEQRQELQWRGTRAGGGDLGAFVTWGVRTAEGGMERRTLQKWTWNLG